jgi:hypothetical protein
MRHGRLEERRTRAVWLGLGLALACVGSPAPRPRETSHDAGSAGGGTAGGSSPGGAAGERVGTGGQGGLGGEASGAGGSRPAGPGGGGAGGGTGGVAKAGAADGVPIECPARVVDGDVNVQGDAALGPLAGVTAIEGALSIGGAALDLGPLRCLERIAGSLTISGASLTSVDGLAALRTVGGRLFVTSNPALVTLGLGRLAAVGSDVWLQNDGALATVDLGALAAVGSYYGSALAFDNLPKLSRVDLHTLAETPPGGALTLSNDGAAAPAPLTLDASSLTAVGNTVSFVSVANLHDVDGLAALRSVGGRLLVTSNAKLQNLDGFGRVQAVKSDVAIEHDALLASIDLGALAVVGSAVGNSLRFNALPSLTTLGLDTLSSVGGCLTITDNPSLPTCQATAPRMRLEELGWTPCGAISGNLPDACSAAP